MSAYGHFVLNIDARENTLLVRIHDAFKLVLKLMALVDKLNFDDEGELAAFPPLRLADDVAAKFADQFTADVQAKSNSACVDFLRFLEKSIHFEKLWHVFLSDTDASVRHTDLQQVVAELELTQLTRQFQILFCLDEPHFDSNCSVSWREFDRVRNQVE